MAYLGNPETGIYHDLDNLGERCNTDALNASGIAMRFDRVPAAPPPRKRYGVRGRNVVWTLCKHCTKTRARKAREAVPA